MGIHVPLQAVFPNVAGSRSGLGGVLPEGRPGGPCLLIVLRPCVLQCDHLENGGWCLALHGEWTSCLMWPLGRNDVHPLFVFVGFMEKLRGGRERAVVIHLFATET